MRSFTRAIGRLAAASAACAVGATVSLGVDAGAPLLAPDFLDFSGDSDEPYVINGDHLTHDRTNAVASAVGHAVVTRGGEVLRADSVRVTMSNRMAYAEGNVTVTRGKDELRCDRLRMDMSNNVAWAVGHVSLTRDKDVWIGETLTYDFRTRRSSIDAFAGKSGPFFVWADSAEQRQGVTNVLVLTNAVLSTCTNQKGHLHFYIKARTLTVTQGESLKIAGATWYLGPVPVFYLPGWYRNLNSSFGFRVRPGYASRWGGFLLTSYSLRPATWLESETHLDYRTRRGVAAGQDFRWRTADRSVSGMLSGYYANDRDPIDSEDDPEQDSLDSQRYRLRLTHEWNLTLSDKFMLNLDYVSDTDVVEDFFDRSARGDRLPDNHAGVVHRGETFTAGLFYRQRLNDFYTVVNRKPEATVDIFRRPLWESGLYYEGESSATLLEQTFAETVDRESYRSARVDAYNRLYYPLRPFNGLSVVPRVGYRLTYYSETPPTEEDEEKGRPDGGAALRRIPEYGMATSLRIARVWPDEERPFRHIVEPYADYTRLLRPSAPPDELYQFDDVDALDMENTVKVGVRNTLQTKRAGDPCTLADVNLYTVVNMDPQPDEAKVDIYTLECDITPYDPLRFRVDMNYSRIEHAVETVDARLSYDAKGVWLIDAGYLVRRDRNRLLSVDTGVRLGLGWRVLVFARYEFEEGQMQEQGVSLRRALDCMTFDFEVTEIPGYTLDDGRERPDEWKVTASLMITAFPDLTLGSHRPGGR